MVKLKKGKTLQDFEDWFLDRGRPPVRRRWTSASASTPASSAPALDRPINYKLPKGNYVMLCFWPDASMGGMPHAFMGMYREIKLK